MQITTVRQVYKFEGPEHQGQRLDFKYVGVDLFVTCSSSCDNKDIETEIKFVGMEMISYTTEPFSVGFDVQSYDVLCEVIHSSWIKERDHRQPPGNKLRHFILYFSNCGYLQVAASNVESILR